MPWGNLDSPIFITGVNHDGHADLITGVPIQAYLGNADGTFVRQAADSGPVAYNLTLADLNGDGNLDIVSSYYASNAVQYALGLGDGTFGSITSQFAGQPPIDLAVADMGSQVTRDDGSTFLGPPDGIPDLIVTATGTTLLASAGPPQITILPFQTLTSTSAAIWS